MSEKPDLKSLISPDMLVQLVAAVGVGVYVTDGDGAAIYANDTMAIMLGYETLEALIAAKEKAQYHYVYAEDRNAIRDLNNAGKTVAGRVWHARRCDGSTFWASEHANPIKDENGTVIGYFGTLVDVSNLIDTQEKLADAEASYRRIFERATEGIYRSSLDGKQLRSNPALNHLNGYETEDQLLNAVKDIATEWYVDPNRRDEFKRLLDRDGAVEDFESEIYCHGSRKRIWISENAYLVRDEDGNPLYYEGTVRDVSARKAADARIREALERAETANRAKTDFLAHMSHELRTPLNAIIGFSDLLRLAGSSMLPDKVQEYASDIHRSGEYLLDLINDILDLSLIESGNLELEKAVVDVQPCIWQTLETVKPMANKRGLVLACLNEPGGQITADERAVRQCLLNLLSNAVRFAPENSTISLSLDRSQEGKLRISVQDAGPGFPQRVLERLGDPFITSQTSIPFSKQSGTGLGLAITHTLMQRMSGALLVGNRPGAGAFAHLIFEEAQPIPKNE